MQRQPRTTTPGGAALRVVACVLFLAASLRAGADVAVYQAVVPLAGTTEADRNAAFGDALRTAAVRATGQRDAGSAPLVAAAAADPARYVQQYSTTPDRMLKVGFDARAMDRLLQQAGLPFWPLERPVTLVLLVVPSVAGGQRAVLASERAPERVELERVALARGLPVAWPEQPVSAAQVRAAMGGDDGAVGDSQYVLAGIDSGGSIAWRFAGVGESARVDGAPRDGANLAADALAARYAPASSRGTSTVEIRVGGIADVRSYASLLEYLKSLSLVRAVGVSGLDDREVRLDVTLRGDLGQLRRIAALDTHLKAAAANQGEVTAADFTYQP